MQRVGLLLLVTALGLAGCLNGSSDVIDPDDAPCTMETSQHTYWLSQGLALRPTLPSVAGRTDGNGASNTFAIDDADEWRSGPFEEGIRINGTVTLDLWVESKGAPAPYVSQGSPNATDPTSSTPPDPSQGWQFFSQFGSTRGFAGTYHNVFGDSFAPPGTVAHYTQTFVMDEGGHVLETGDRLRLLLTSLAADGPDGGGSHTILWGGETPSRLTFEATCYPDRSWELLNVESEPIIISGNQGALGGAVPATENVNFADVRFTLLPNTERLTITLRESDPSDGTKDDMDLSVRNADGEVWSIGSPYADETGTYWKMNLEALMPPGDYTVRTNSYSGTDYEGTLTITQEQAVA